MAEALEKADMSDQGTKEQIGEMTEGHGQDEEQIVAVAASLGAIPKIRSPRQDEQTKAVAGGYGQNKEKNGAAVEENSQSTNFTNYMESSDWKEVRTKNKEQGGRRPSPESGCKNCKEEVHKKS